MSDTLISPPRKRRRLTSRQKETIAGYLFVLPDALGLLIFLGLPMLMSFGLALFNVDGFGGYHFVGLGNYRRMLADPIFWQSVKVTLSYAVMLVPLTYATGLGLALMVQRTNRFNGIVRLMYFAPHVVSLVVVALVWQFMAIDKVGILSRLASDIGLGGMSLLGDPKLALFTVVLVSVWYLMGYYMLIFLGGLQDIPREYYEAARVDGAGPLAQFWFITLPLLRPTTFFVILVSTVAATAGAQAFDIIFVMTQGGPSNATSVLIIYIYEQAFKIGAFGYAAAMASTLVVLLMAFTLVFYALTKGGRFAHGH